MLPSNAAAVVCEAPLVFEYRAPIFFVFNPNTGLRQAYPPEIFFATLAAAADCARGFRFDTDAPCAEIIPIAEARANRGP
jgi:hypothetical protein